MSSRSFARPQAARVSRHHLRQSVSCLSSIENTAPSLTSTFRTMQIIGELHVVAPGLDARDSQALVVVDGSIAIILALVGTPVVGPRRRHLECRDRIQGEVPESNALTVLRQNRRGHKCECDRSKQYNAHPSLQQVDALHGAAEENL